MLIELLDGAIPADGAIGAFHCALHGVLALA
jgi:hypothetical protein